MDAVLLGGLVGVGGSAVTLGLTQLFSALHTKKQRAHELRVLRRAKLEELGARLNDGYRELNEMGWSTNIFQLRGYSDAPDLRSAYVLTLVYFPSLTPHVDVLQAAWLRMYSMFLSLGEEDGVSVFARAVENVPELHEQAYEGFLRARREMDSAIAAHGSEYVRS